MSGERRGDVECASLDIIASEGPRRRGEEEIDVIANDLMIEDRGRIERGAALGIVGGGCARTCGSSNFSVEPWSEVIDT